MTMKADWTTTPGSYDKLHIGDLFPSSNAYGIPDLLYQDFVPLDLIPYGTEVRRGYAQTKGKTVHFFLDDYRFESLWDKPIKTLNPIIKQGQALSPDFSLYVDYPIALQIFNVYRNRWLARYWQEQGVQVIPTVTWSDYKSYDFAFLGIPKHSPVAISTVGIARNKNDKLTFLKGLSRMIEVLEPKRIILYGNDKLEGVVFPCPVHYYDTFWTAKKRT